MPSTASEREKEAAKANQLYGRVQYAQALQKLATVTSLSDLAELKKSKGYKNLQFEKDGELVTVTTWAGFCKVLGYSPEKIDTDIRNQTAFGEQAYESMQQMGVGSRQMLILRQLPEEDRKEIIDHVEQNVGDKDALMLLIGEKEVKHHKELEAQQAEIANLKAQQQEAEQTQQASDALLAQKETTIRELTEKVVARNNLTPDQEIADWSSTTFPFT